jgi:hypothetical protein
MIGVINSAVEKDEKTHVISHLDDSLMCSLMFRLHVCQYIFRSFESDDRERTQMNCYTER